MTKSAKPSYAELQAELTDVMSQLQAEDIDIDEALKLHGQASTLITQLEKHLAGAKLTISKLKVSEK